ncbi:hypothetical protein QU38_00695, partial [Staphylococcus aureus]
SRARRTAGSIRAAVHAGLYVRLDGGLHDDGRHGEVEPGAAARRPAAARNPARLLGAVRDAVRRGGMAHAWLGILSARRRHHRRPWRRCPAGLAALLPGGGSGRLRDCDLFRQWRAIDFRPAPAGDLTGRSGDAG